jgi:hypothetical protein
MVVHMTAADPADVLYPIWRTGTGAFTEPSESFKRTGTGDVTVTGLTNDIARYGVLAVAKRGGLYSLPSLQERFCTPTAGTATPSGQLSLPLHYLRQTLAASGAFQALVGAGDAAEALDSIHPVCVNLARARAAVSAAGVVTGLVLEDGGRGYRTAPAVAIRGEGASATATATVSSGRVTGLVLGAGGTGYVGKTTEVDIAPPTHPLAIVDWMPEYSDRAIAGGDRNYFQAGGQLVLLLRATVNPAHSEKEAAYTFMNLAGAIVEDLEELAGVAGYLNIREIRKTSGPERPDEDERQALLGRGESEWIQAAFAVAWGV